LESGARKVDPEEKKKVDQMHFERSKIRKIRKQTCMEIINTIADGLSIKPKSFMAEAGLEDDV